MTFGEVEKGFEAADEIFEDTFYYEGNTHLPMEQHAAIGVPEDDDRVTLYSSSQTPHYVHRALSKVLEAAAPRVRVVAAPNGGGSAGERAIRSITRSWPRRWRSSSAGRARSRSLARRSSSATAAAIPS